MALCPSGGKSLSEPMIVYFSSAYISLGLNELNMGSNVTRFLKVLFIHVPRSYPSLKNTPFSWIFDEKNTLFSTEIAGFEAQ